MAQLILTSLYMGLVVFLMGVVCGGPLLSVIEEFRAWRWRTRFKDKLAQQTARMSIVAFFCLFIVLGATFVSYFLLQKSSVERFLVKFVPGHWFPLILWGTGIVFLFIYYLTWKHLKKSKFWHWCLGLLGMLAFWMGLFSSVNLILRLLLIKQLQLFSNCYWMCLLLDVKIHSLWPLLGQFVLIALGGSGALAANYLLMRREKDDFGRDYYRSSLYSVVKWAFIFAANIICLLVFMYFTTESYQFLLHYARLVPLLLFLVFIILPVVLWGFILKSENPMRNKVSIVSSLFSSWLALSSLFLYYYQVLNAL